ncbi:MAG: STAS-like domain-containing protein [Opitutales bacterium]|nr:STAS-like domain-containing protein [Opitutales bacterium]
MNTKRINFVEDFTDCPGGRLRVTSEHSGEAFREDVLLPALNDNDRVEVDMNGAFGFPSSFLDEVFGKIVDNKGLAFFKEKVEILLDDDPISLIEINDIVQKHSKRK